MDIWAAIVLIYKYFLKSLISILWNICLGVVLINHVLVLLFLLNIMSFKFTYVFVYISIFYFYVVLYRMNIPQFSYWFYCWWIFKLFPVWDYYCPNLEAWNQQCWLLYKLSFTKFLLRDRHHSKHFTSFYLRFP